MQGLWFAITNDHLSSDSRARIYPELLGDSETSFPLPLASLRTPAPRTVPHILDAPSTCFNSGTCTRCWTGVAPWYRLTCLPSSRKRNIRHSLKLHWFADLMNVTEEVTIHRPNVSTLLSSAFIRGDLNAATRGPFIRSLISGLFSDEV